MSSPSPELGSHDEAAIDWEDASARGEIREYPPSSLLQHPNEASAAAEAEVEPGVVEVRRRRLGGGGGGGTHDAFAVRIPSAQVGERLT